jgi:hypothetical protein
MALYLLSNVTFERCNVCFTISDGSIIAYPLGRVNCSCLFWFLVPELAPIIMLKTPLSRKNGAMQHKLLDANVLLQVTSHI